jgi:serine/threonine protein phosphatase 1
MFFWRRKPALVRPSVPKGLRLYAVGDIHGRLDLLDRLHARILDDLKTTREARARIIYLGDYVDRGPDSAAVIDRLLERPLGDVETVCLKGNHEAMMLDFLARPEIGAKWFAIGAAATVASYGLPWRGGIELSRTASELAEHLPDRHRAFLESLEMQHRSGDFLFVHAGIRPGRPLDRQMDDDLLWIRQPFLDSRADHGMVVVHGHTPVDRPDERSNRIGIDTGAVFTDVLTCLVLEGETRRYLATDA